MDITNSFKISHNLFGTDGIRTKVGLKPLVENDILDLGKAIYIWAQEKNNCTPKILIADDSRISSSWIKSLLNAGLLRYDSIIYDAGILPTPAVYALVQKLDTFDFGIMITASHNEYQDNGIKIIQRGKNKISLQDELRISEIFFNKDFKNIDYENLGKYNLYKQAQKDYINLISKYFKPNFLKNIKIVIDCANGATTEIAPLIFSSFAANIITINNCPDGKNINKDCGSTHPENLQQAIIKYQADLGFAFDGDGDRIVAVSKNNELKNGDDILALLINHPNYLKYDTIVTTEISNYALEFHLQNKNKKVIKTPVGDKYVSLKMTQENLALGGEPSGHIILGNYLNSSDGIFVALTLCQLINYTQNWNMHSFDKFPQINLNIPVKIKKDLTENPFFNIIEKYKLQLPNGRLITRYSGTEPLLRIMVEDKDNDLAKNISHNLSQELQQAFNQNLER